MKRIDELGISPLPWKAEDTLSSFPIRTVDVACEGYKVAKNVLEHDARLFAAAPELYRALYNLVKLHEDCSNNECDDCPRGIGNGRKCDVEEDDILELAYHAIAKAAGEEVAK